MTDLPDWATLTPIGDGRWRLDLDGDLHGTRLAGHATGTEETLRGLVHTLTGWPGPGRPAEQERLRDEGRAQILAALTELRATWERHLRAAETRHELSEHLKTDDGVRASVYRAVLADLDRALQEVLRG